MKNPYKILFVKPCSDIKPQFVEIPLAFLYLSSYLKKHLNTAIDISLIDLRLERKPDRALQEALTRFKPDLIGISLLAQDRNFLPQWSGFFKANAPDAKIVIGGPYVTYEYEEALLHNRWVKLAVIGEGERAFLHLVKTLLNDGDIEALKGIAFVKNDAITCNGKEQYIEDIDEIPMPDYSIIRPSRYHGPFHLPMNVIVARKRYAPVVSSRGCPYGCIYCHNIFGKKVRQRSPENFVAELVWLHKKHKIQEIHILDDIFNINRERMHAILHRIIECGLQIKIAFPNGLRGDLLSFEDIRLLQQAGTYMITFAVETASPEMQKKIHKYLNIEKTMRNIEYASSLGIVTRGAFILGFPEETVKEIKETIALAIQSKLDLAAFLTAVPFKNTEMGLMADKLYSNLKWEGNWYCWDTKPFYQKVTGYNLKRTQTLAYLKFYIPFRIIRTFLKVPSKISMLMWPIWGGQIFFPSAFKNKKSLLQLARGRETD